MEQKKSKAKKAEEAQKEVGRYKKKVEDQQKVIESLGKQVAMLDSQVLELNRIMNADLAALTVKYGKYDKEAGGWRLEIGVEDVTTALLKYEVRARKDEERNVYVIGVLPREEKADGD